MAIEVISVPRPAWSPLPFEGCRDVEGKVFLAQERLTLAMLRFSKDATIHEHAAEHDIDVTCVEGSGRKTVGDEQAALQAGERVRWPANLAHRLWTEGDEMVTLMVEHHASREKAGR